MSNFDYKEIEKYARMTGERALIDAKIFDTYIIYKNKNGEYVREYPDGRIEKGETKPKNG